MIRKLASRYGDDAMWKIPAHRKALAGSIASSQCALIWVNCVDRLRRLVPSVERQRLFAVVDE
jgi:hypothetical protein